MKGQTTPRHLPEEKGRLQGRVLLLLPGRRHGAVADLEAGVSGSGGRCQGWTRHQEGAALWRWPCREGRGSRQTGECGAGFGQAWTLA